MTHDENTSEQVVCQHVDAARCATTKVHDKCRCAPPKSKIAVEEAFDYTHYEEGGSSEIAGGFELLQETQHYQHLSMLFEQPSETIGNAFGLLELRAACVGDFDTEMNDEQLCLFSRVHTELDWDERRELIDALDELERLDVDGVVSDCFTSHKTYWNRTQTVIRMIYRLCCIDEEFRAGSQHYTLFCLCDTPNECVNPQHYIHCKSRSLPRTSKKRRQSQSPSVDVVEQTRTELAKSKDCAETQRLTAMLGCLTDQFALDGAVAADTRECAFDFEETSDDSSGSGCYNEFTPTMTSNTSGAATPISNNAKRKATDLIVIGGKRRRASTPSPPAAACKPMATAYNSQRTQWSTFVEIV